MLTWTLDRGFRGLFAAPAPRMVDWLGLRRVCGNLPFRFGGVRVSAIDEVSKPAEAGLGSRNVGEQTAAIAAVSGAVDFARRLGCGRIVLDPGLVPVVGEVLYTDLSDRRANWTVDSARALFARRKRHLDQALDCLCRSLHQLCRSHEDVLFCLTLSRNALGLGEAAALAAVFEDLARYRIGYWHDTVAAACRETWLSQEPGEILEIGSKVLKGMTLGDFANGEAGLPPGAGGVDYPLLSAYRQPSDRDFPVVAELNPGVDPGEIPGIHAYLNKFRL